MNQNDPALARRYGSLITLMAVAGGLLYFVALVRRSYWAVAIPMTAIVLGLTAAAAVLGRLLMTTPDDSDEPGD